MGLGKNNIRNEAKNVKIKMKLDKYKNKESKLSTSIRFGLA
jgi:hypothetical protein